MATRGAGGGHCSSFIVIIIMIIIMIIMITMTNNIIANRGTGGGHCSSGYDEYSKVTIPVYVCYARLYVTMILETVSVSGSR